MIRNATPSDIPRLIELGELMHDESPRFKRRGWHAPKVCGLMDWLISNEDGLLLVAEVDGVIVGGFLGMVAEHYFCIDRVATDLALFVHPEHRGGLAALRMLRAYVKWARNRNADDITVGITTGVHLDTTTRLFELAGFQHVGHLFEYKGA